MDKNRKNNKSNKNKSEKLKNCDFFFSLFFAK